MNAAGADPEKRDAAESLADWVRKHGFDARIARAGNVEVTRLDRQVTKSEVATKCHFRGEYLRQIKDGVVVKA
jgi:hypothetical protein